MNFSMTEEIKKQGALLGTVGAVGGFISDVLQPLAPVSHYVFIVSLVSTGLLLFSLIILKARRKRLFHALLLTSAFAVFSGILVGVSSDDTKAKGVIASKIPAIAQLQASLGIIQKDIAEIKEATQKTAKAVEKLEKTSRETAQATKQIAKSSEKIAQTLETIQKGFSQLSASGGVISAPSKPQEFYHNARIYEQKGDYLNARKSYNRLFTFKLDFLDPHLRYQTFLKVQEGRAGAREVYNALYENDQRPVMDFARILLFNAPQRITLLKEFIKTNPDFAPAYYELSRDYSKARKGVQSLKDRQEELKSLEKFTALNEQGKFLKYFIDKELAAKWLKDAETRLKALEALKRSSGDNPVRLQTSRSNSGWNIYMVMRETPKEIFYRIGEEGDFKSTGMTERRNQATGFTIPDMNIQLPPKSGATTIYVKYTDVGGEQQGPFKLEFNPTGELVKNQKKILNATKNSWVSFRDFNNKLLVYFTHLVSYRCSLEEIRYSFDSTDLDQQFEVAACDPAKPFNIPTNGKVYLEAPKTTKSVTVRIKFRDGEQSEAYTIQR